MKIPALLAFLALTTGCAVVRAPLDALRAGKVALEDATGHANSKPRMAAKQREEFLTSFVGRHSSAMMDEFGPPDSVSGDPATGGYATYYVPMYSGVMQKIVFSIAADDTITNVNYWPK